MTQRREMELWDWINTGFLLLIGLLLGIALDYIGQLVAMGFWVIAVILLLLFLAVFLFELLMDKIVNRIFTIAVRQVNEPSERKKKPLMVILSFPSGVLLGVLLARVGLSIAILDLIKNL